MNEPPQNNRNGSHKHNTEKEEKARRVKAWSFICGFRTVLIGRQWQCDLCGEAGAGLVHGQGAWIPPMHLHLCFRIPLPISRNIERKRKHDAALDRVW